MFLEFDNYTVNLAQVAFIGLGIDTIERDHGDEPSVRLWIHFDNDGDPISLPQRFETEGHANTFKRQVIRQALAKGVLDAADLESIFYETKPGTPNIYGKDSQYVFVINGSAPLAEIKSALHNFADHFGAHQTNSEGNLILWSKSGWNCGTAHPAREVGE
jgi:hypothetical protein